MVAATTLLICSAPARAQQGGTTNLPNLQLQQFRPAPGPADYFDAYGSGVTPHLDWNAGLYLDYAAAPIRIPVPSDQGNRPVSQQITGSLIGSFGLFNVVEVGVLLPATLYQSAGQLGPVVDSGQPAALESQAVNDLRATLKVQLLKLLTKPVGLSLVGNVYAPLGTPNAFAGGGGVGAEGLVAFETWLWRGARMDVNLGYRYRPERTTIRASTLGDSVLWSVAFNVPLFISTLDAIAEFDGAFSLAKDTGPTTGIPAGEVPAEFKLGGRIALTDGVSLSLGLGARLGDGIGAPNFRGFMGIGGWWVSGGEMSYDYDGDGFSGRSDACPDAAEDVDNFEDADGCPDTDDDDDGVADTVDDCPHTTVGMEVDARGCITNDFDGDGIANNDDKCFEDPEDWDGFQDDDGCPDNDNDQDGVADLADQCAGKKETVNGFRDEDGCPDDPDRSVMVVGRKIVLNRSIHFQEGSARIRAKSHKILDAVVGLLKDHPEFLLVRIEGHTDSQGAKAYNRQLSQTRAEAVRDYLVDGGISPKRLAPNGFGESQPVATNDTASGRAKNRRVEFIILKSTGDDGR